MNKQAYYEGYREVAQTYGLDPVVLEKTSGAMGALTGGAKGALGGGLLGLGTGAVLGGAGGLAQEALFGDEGESDYLGAMGRGMVSGGLGLGALGAGIGGLGGAAVGHQIDEIRPYFAEILAAVEKKMEEQRRAQELINEALREQHLSGSR